MKASSTKTKAKTEIVEAANEAIQLLKDATSKATVAISDAALGASKLIASNALEATRLLASNASEAAKIVNIKGSDDHDILMKLETKVDILIISVDKMNNKDDDYVLKEDFTFWRNLLVSGMILTIFIGIITNFIKQ